MLFCVQSGAPKTSKNVGKPTTDRLRRPKKGNRKENPAKKKPCLPYFFRAVFFLGGNSDTANM